MAWAYAGVWTAGPVYEDHNPAVAQEDAILEPSNPLVDDWVWFRRPVTNLSYRLTNNLGGGARAAHVASLLLHVAVVAAVAVFAGLVGSSPWVAGAVMLLHPLASESVVYLSARSELLATLAVLLCLIALTSGHLLVGIGCAGLAFLCNPAPAAALIGLLPLCVWRGWIPIGLRQEVLALVGLLVVCVVFGFGRAGHTAELTAPAPWLVYVGHQVAGTVALAGRVVVPWPLLIDHGFAWTSWGLVLARVSLLALALGAAVALRQRCPWALLLVGWWVLGFGARLWVPSWNYLTEHHAYLPLVGVALVAGELVSEAACAA